MTSGLGGSWESLESRRLWKSEALGSNLLWRVAPVPRHPERQQTENARKVLLSPRPFLCGLSSLQYPQRPPGGGWNSSVAAALASMRLRRLGDQVKPRESAGGVLSAMISPSLPPTSSSESGDTRVCAAGGSLPRVLKLISLSCSTHCSSLK